jgi:DNA anti-recombination protein RmuC
MDPSLIEYLDRRFDETRQELLKFRLETSERFEEMREETSTRFEEMREETSTRFDDLKTEIRHLHVLLEDHGSRLQAVAEGVASNDQKITRLRSEMNGQFEDLKGVLYPSIQGLGRRVTDLEAR